ncbi:cytochrome P450 [Favolaschia claudopus]|uniref:Cytochrome P450 n=1 Tax=Favolaschia claudopus TaxID=2862362 RepID=A0AAW0BP11_9AGAR
MPLNRLVFSVLGSLGVYALYKILKLIQQEYTSDVRLLPGPKSTHWLFGNLKEIFNSESNVLQEQWIQQYGSTIKYKVFLWETRLYTTDATAINHFLTNAQIYQKPESARYTLARMLGQGVLVAEGEHHRQQRRVMNPAFGAAQIRELTEIFVAKSTELRDIWALQVANAGGAARIDVLAWLSFNYNFSNLSSEGTSELGQAFAEVFRTGTTFDFISALKTWIPAFRFIPTRFDTNMASSRATMMRIGRQLLEDSRKEMAESGTFEKGRSRDLLSLLVRSNTAKDIPANQRLSDEDVLAQVPTFLVAGHETTSTATTWALFALAQDLRVQTRLREELLTVSTDNPTMDELNELSYLDCVVRETLRVHSPVTSTLRVAIEDDVVPLATAFRDVHGVLHDTIRIRKGQTVMIPVLAMNRDKTVWGPDSFEFSPERWESNKISNSIPGVWSHMLTFLGGPRACIGYRFSIVEMKALLFTLVRSFEFELAVPASEIQKKTSIVQRPLVKSEPEAGNQLPLIIKPYVHS